VKTIMSGMGYAVMGTASASGAKRTVEAAQRAIASPLLEAGAIDGARGILINITGSATLKLSEVNEASTLIQTAAHEDANIIFGAVLDESMGDDVKITVIATGFKQGSAERRELMLNAAIRPEPAAARIEARPVTPRFASEEEDLEIVPAPGRLTPPAPVFVPVTAREVISVFAPEPPRPEPSYLRAEPEPAAEHAEPVAVAVAAEPAQSEIFADTPGPLFEPEPAEDLDIPAFMRKGGL
jgi:cell division protein FtsZ